MTECPVCGLPMVHYRLTGYRCIVERHNEMVREAGMRELALLRRHKKLVEKSEMDAQQADRDRDRDKGSG